MFKSPWTHRQDERLRGLWNTGMGCTSIAALLGKTKNAVIGRAHRMRLAGRAHPIAGHVTKPPEMRERRVRRIATRVPIEEPAPVPEPAVVEEAAPTTETEGGPYRPFMLPPGRCQWIAGEPSADDRCKCGQRAVPGLPYCPEHQLKAYQRRAPEPVEGV